MPYSLSAEELREGLCVYELNQPENPGSVVSWCVGGSADDTTVTVKWLGHSSTTTHLSSLKHFGRFVSEVRASSDRYSRLLDELRHMADRWSAAEGRTCLTCGHKDVDFAAPLCATCKPVTGGAVNWIGRAAS